MNLFQVMKPKKTVRSGVKGPRCAVTVLAILSPCSGVACDDSGCRWHGGEKWVSLSVRLRSTNTPGGVVHKRIFARGYILVNDPIFHKSV